VSHTVVYQLSCERLRGTFTADDNEGCSPRKLGQRDGEHFVEKGLNRQVLIVIEDERSGERHFGPQLAQEPSCESWHIRHEFWRQRRQSKFLPASCSLCGLCEVVKEGGEVSIARVHVIPQ